MKHRILKIIFGPLVLLLMYGLYFFHVPIPCLFHKITHFYCPGCGLTRCLDSFFHFQFYQAFRYNPLIFILLPFLIPYVLYLYIVYCFDLSDRITPKIPNTFWYGLCIITLLFGILRNFPAFSFLQPTIIS